jgi:hypothetical protein
MNYGEGPPTKKRPLVCYSDNCNLRASLVSAATGKPMPATKRRKRGASVRRGRRRRVGTGKRRRVAKGGRRRRRVGGGRSKVRIVRGKISIRVAGFPGYQRIGASQLVRFVPLAKLRVAAKRVLGGRRRPAKGGRRRRRRRAASSVAKLF